MKQAVEAAAPAGIPLTVKMRKGIDDHHLTYVEAGLIAQEAGVAAVALHARTAEQRYSGTADWDAIGELVESVDIPVLGNGDIWEAADALRMVEQTGVAAATADRRIAPSRLRFHGRAAPPPLRVTFGTGQPKFMSM